MFYMMLAIFRLICCIYKGKCSTDVFWKYIKEDLEIGKINEIRRQKLSCYLLFMDALKAF